MTALDGRTILVTGGTGSFGRKFTEAVIKHAQPRKLIIFSRDEMKQGEMRKEFPDAGDSPMRYFIGDVRDADRLRRAMNGVDVVIHAAALKQVPSCEYNPFEAVKTNVLGAQNVIEAAIDCGVKKVLGISTDKAVSPVNIYGATKLCAEKLFVNGNSYSRESGARFSCCRYGNVVGSRGSVVPIFQEQQRSGLITITDPRMTRFWLMLQQGVDFVIRCLDVMRGGEVFVPKIPSMRVVDLARAMAPNTPVQVVGIRPGEKIHESLVSEDEARDTVELDDMYVVGQPESPWSHVAVPQGRRLPAGFTYTSDNNSAWLSADELRALVTRE